MSTFIDIIKRLKASDVKVVCSVRSKLLNILEFLYFVIFATMSIEPD
jgi:hypothetical protein